VSPEDRVHAPRVQVESQLTAVACKTLPQALTELRACIIEWMEKHIPAQARGSRSSSNISMETAMGPQWAAVFDLDETVLHYSEGQGLKSDVDKDCRVPKEMFTFLNFLRSRRIKIVYITARRERMKSETQRTLDSLNMWREGDTLVLKPNDWPPESSSLYKHHARKLVEDRGYSILMNAGDQFSDLMSWQKWRTFMERVRTELSPDHVLRVIAQQIRASDTGTNQLKQFAASIHFPIILYALEPNIPFSLKLPQQEFFTK
jgi:HAD superfamily, subfamily IIIB (Acid phosphatase)